jgi:5-methylcytosine-specific restriction endonuclease McrA
VAPWDNDLILAATIINSYRRQRPVQSLLGSARFPMNSPTKTIQSICELLKHGSTKAAGKVLHSEYPFLPVRKEKRTYTPRESMAVFIRDGFIDRYSGARLIFPGTLRLIHKLLPDEFPFHTNWKMSETHFAFWELFPTIDHIIPVARGGRDVAENWVTTSQIRNSAKSNWLLAELGWQLLPAGSTADWDGLTGWNIEYMNANPDHLNDPYMRIWHKAALAHVPPEPSPKRSAASGEEE